MYITDYCNKNGCYQLRAMLFLPKRKGCPVADTKMALIYLRTIWLKVVMGLNLMKVGVLLRHFKHTMLKIIKCVEHTDKNDSAQIAALIEASDSVFKLSVLRHLYRTLVATRFKEYLLKLLPKWEQFSRGKDVIISNNWKVGHLLAEAHSTLLNK